MHLYAHPASQPSRAVLWYCAINQVACVVSYDPAVDLSAHNPRQQMPVLEIDGQYLAEMPAILGFLASTQNDGPWLPKQIAERAKIDSYLHSHHSLTRLATLKLMAPHVLTVFDDPPMGPITSAINNEVIQAALSDPDKLTNGQVLMDNIAEVFTDAYLSSNDGFIGGRSQPSIADLAAYEEFQQLVWAGLYSFEKFGKIQTWLGRVSELAHHEAIHRFNTTLSDIVSQPIDMARFIGAIEAGITGLEDAGLTLVDAT